MYHLCKVEARARGDLQSSGQTDARGPFQPDSLATPRVALLATVMNINIAALIT